MFYRIKENGMEKCPKNGSLKNGVKISNLELYFDVFEEAANENGYYRAGEGEFVLKENLSAENKEVSNGD